MVSKTLRIAALLVLGACAATESDETEDQSGAWEAQNAFDETKSTHLWLVNNAIEALGRHKDDPVAARATTLLNHPVCRLNWELGLVDADHKAEYNNGREDLPLNPGIVKILKAKTTWASHFYDPDTGKNYKGQTSPTGFTEARSHLGKALESGLAKEPSRAACYELGLALHYFTDLTQGMHAANFTALSKPFLLHASVEDYSMELQDRFPLADWTGKPSGTTDDLVVQTARASKASFRVLLDAINRVSRENLRCRNQGPPSHSTPHPVPGNDVCWMGNDEVDQLLGKELIAAQDNTAKYIYLVVQQLEAKAAE